jgi:outer membrane protein assembly factor BamC
MNRPMFAGRLARLCLLFLLAASVAACSLGRKLEERTQIDYKSAGKQRTPALDVPPDLASPRGSDRYRVPDLPSQPTYSGYERDRRQAQAADSEAIASRTAQTQAGALRIERSGQQRWLSTSMSPEELWPLVRDFWQESGFIIDSEDPQTGIMETDWAENRAKLPQDFIRRAVGSLIDSLYSTGERDKFRTRLERVPGGTEIYVTHRGMVEVYQDKVEKDSTIWQPRPSDPELEVEFLRRLMVKLGADTEQADASAAAARGGPPRAAIRLEQGPGGDALLTIPDGFERAWRRVGLALDRGGFAVEDRDRSNGVYFVRYIDPESDARRAKEGGFLSGLFGGSRKERTQTEVFQIRVESSGEESTVRVRSGDGEAVRETDRTTAARMLGLIQEQLQL